MKTGGKSCPHQTVLGEHFWRLRLIPLAAYATDKDEAQRPIRPGVVKRLEARQRRRVADPRDLVEGEALGLAGRNSHRPFARVNLALE